MKNSPLLIDRVENPFVVLMTVILHRPAISKSRSDILCKLEHESNTCVIVEKSKGITLHLSASRINTPSNTA